MSISTVSSRAKVKTLHSTAICIDCPQENIPSKASHFTMAKGSKPFHTGQEACNSNIYHKWYNVAFRKT